MSKLRTSAALLGLVAGASALLLALAAPALAHDKLLRSSPADGATVAHLPRTITLYFEEPPVSGFTSMSVSGPSGKKINSTGPVVTVSRISEPVKTSNRAGTYTIKYRILSDDGHPVSGIVHFIVGTPPVTAKAVVKKVTSAPKTSTSTTTLLYIVGAAAAIGVALAVAARSRRRPQPAPAPTLR